MHSRRCVNKMYPAMLQLQGQPITIIGGGKVALRKAKAFVTFGGEVTVISHQFEPELLALSVKCVTGEYTEADLEGSFVVVAATNDPAVNLAIGNYCREHRMLCNVIDNPKLSTLTMPAYMKRGDLVISVSTGGTSPSLAKQIKKELEASYSEAYVAYLELLGELRSHIITHHTDEKIKKEMLQQLITMNLEELRDYANSYFNR